MASKTLLGLMLCGVILNQTACQQTPPSKNMSNTTPQSKQASPLWGGRVQWDFKNDLNKALAVAKEKGLPIMLYVDDG